MGDISLYFDRKEFTCKCGCGRNNISLNLVFELNRLRGFYGKPIYINSGCRCIEHNTDVGGKPNSAHICEGKEGEAVDIKIVSGGQLFTLLGIIYKWQLFKRIGIGTTLLHVDISTVLPSPTVWVYSNK